MRDLPKPHAMAVEEWLNEQNILTVTLKNPKE